MKKIFSLLFALVATTSIAQTTFSPSMINNGGGSGVVGTTYYDYTVGEPVTLFGGPACDSIFSGFQHCAADTLRLKQTTITASGITSFCLNDNVQLMAPSGSFYLWSNGATTQNIIVTTSGNYNVRVTNSCGDTIRSNTISVNVLTPPQPTICMVTVDSLSTHNVIIWEKASYANVDTFVVYREITFNNYQIIGKVPYDSLSSFTDTVATLYLPNTGDPNFTSYKYALRTIDTCGNLSARSPFHKTIKMNDQFNGNFDWNHYEIEGQSIPVPGLAAYELKRDNNLDGIYETSIGSTTAISATDAAYFTFQNTADWRIFTNWGISCNPTLRVGQQNETQFTITKTRSNIKNNRVSGINSSNKESGIKVFPNPATNDITIMLAKECNNCILQIVNTLGQTMMNEKLSSLETKINISNFENGIYYVKIISENKQTFLQKVIVQK